METILEYLSFEITAQYVFSIEKNNDVENNIIYCYQKRKHPMMAHCIIQYCTILRAKAVKTFSSELVFSYFY